MKFITSDLHFRHSNIISLCNRPFKDISEMEDMLIKNWNETVRKCDTVYILGDITMGKSKTVIDPILSKLNWTKIIIKGNHDKESISDYTYLEESFLINDKQYEFVMFHYPIEDWNGKYKGTIHVHGHTHSKEKSNMPNRYNVSVEANDYRPVSIVDIVKYLNR